MHRRNQIGLWEIGTWGPAVMVLVGALAPSAFSQQAGVVSHIKVLSDKVEDVSSLQAWKQSWIKPGMSDEEKAIACWQTVVKYRHQTSPPNEFLQPDENVHDVMKTIHVYGYGMCCCAASNLEQLGRYLGFPARGRIIRLHSVPELYYDDAWHLFDSSLINYFHQPDGGIASVDDLIRAVGRWHQKNPGFARDGRKLREFARNWGWKKGPALLAGGEFYTKDGWNLAGTHGWPATMQEYDCQPGQIYEYGYSQGCRLNVQLRPGERLTRNWFNKGLHVNMDGAGGAPGCLGQRAGMGYQRKLGDIAPGRVGNGIYEYDVPLDNGAFRTGALVVENLADKSGSPDGPAVRVREPGKPGRLILRMPSSYVYLTGALIMDAVVASGGKIAVYFSDNNGLDWKQVTEWTESADRTIDLSRQVFRRYDYRLKFELRGRGTGLNRLKITHDVQHSQAPLPALGQGKNTVTFSAGPHEGTVTIEGRPNPSRKRGELLATDFHPDIDNLEVALLRVADYGPTGGHVTFPVSTPGDMTRLRFGGHFRARDAREGWQMVVSFDDGKTFTRVGDVPGPTAGVCKYVTVDSVPPGTRKALVRFQGTRQRNTLCIFNLRIDADYREPFGGFRPVKITYVWDEGGVEKSHVHIAREPDQTYEVVCGERPLMKSLILEIAGGGER